MLSLGILIKPCGRIGQKTLLQDDQKPPRALSTRTLIRERTAPNLGELSWRVGLALAAINLTLIGLVVSSGNPRVGRSGNLFFSLFAFILYYNLLNLGQSWISGGTANFYRFMLLLHGGVFVVAVAWLFKRHFNWTPGMLLQRRNAGIAAAGTS